MTTFELIYLKQFVKISYQGKLLWLPVAPFRNRNISLTQCEIGCKGACDIMHCGSQLGSAANAIQELHSPSPHQLAFLCAEETNHCPATAYPSSPGGNHSNRLDRRPPSTYHFLRKLSPHWFLPEWSGFPILLLQERHAGLYPKTGPVFNYHWNIWRRGTLLYSLLCVLILPQDWLPVFSLLSSPLKANISNVRSKVNVTLLCIPTVI